MGDMPRGGADPLGGGGGVGALRCPPNGLGGGGMLGVACCPYGDSTGATLGVDLRAGGGLDTMGTSFH